MLVAKKTKAVEKPYESNNKKNTKSKQLKLKPVNKTHQGWEMSAEEALRINFVDREF